jgi:hypothetical protein
MTEWEWFAPDSAWRLERELLAVVQRRKLFLLGCAFLRRVWALLRAAEQLAVETTERYARGQSAVREVLDSWFEALESTGESFWLGARRDGESFWLVPGGDLLRAGVREAFHEPACFAAQAAWQARDLVRDAAPVDCKAEAWRLEQRAQLDLYVDLVGDPMEVARPAPAFAREPAVRGLVTALDRSEWIEPVAMLALADALEEAGCAEEAVLEHCRGGGTHQHGCWVLELLLGRANRAL